MSAVALTPWLGKSMFRDEGASLYSAHLHWSALWQQSRHVDLVFIAYYALLHVWIVPSGSIGWIRVLSLLAYGVTVLGAGHLGLRLAGRWCGVAAAVLTATNPTLVSQALNARPYELAAAGSVCCAGALLRWLRGGGDRWLWVFCSLALVVTLLQLFAALAPGCMLLAAVAARPRRFVERARHLLVPVGLTGALVVLYAAAAAGQVGQVGWIAHHGVRSLQTEVFAPLGGDTWYSHVLVLIVLGGAGTLAYRWDRAGRSVLPELRTLLQQDGEFLSLCVGWAIFPTAALAIASLAHPVFVVRYVTPSEPGAALAVALLGTRVWAPGPAAVDAATGRSQRWLALPAVGILALLVSGCLSPARAVSEDLQGAATYIADHAAPGDRTVLSNHAMTAAIDYYLSSSRHPMPTWPQRGARQPNIDGLDLVRHPVFPEQPPTRLWVVNDGTNRRVGRLLAGDGYIAASDRRFPGVSVLLFQPPDGHSRQRPSEPNPLANL